MEKVYQTPIIKLEKEKGNSIFVKREDLLPFSFGGNKARKAKKFFEAFDKGGYDCVVTYGTSHSNHCRVVSNLAIQRNVPCYIIGPEEVSEKTFNSKMNTLLCARTISVPLDKVGDTIEDTINMLKGKNAKPFFIEGGGHGNIGTDAYVECYEEIKRYERETGTSFDYIFFASGTGTTQAGLVCGKLMCSDKKEIIGISIARKMDRGKSVVVKSIFDYLQEHSAGCSLEKIENNTVFVDNYVCGGYGKYNEDICNTIDRVFKQYGLPLDTTYTGKAYFGMLDYLEKKGVKGKNVLFLHTGGTPLFFDYIDKEK